MKLPSVKSRTSLARVAPRNGKRAKIVAAENLIMCINISIK